MLTIRLTRKGKKNQPFFRVVVIDSRRSSKGGRAVEDLGYSDPIAKRVSVNAERAKYWVSKGAQPSDTVHNLLVNQKIIDAKKIPVKVKKAPVAAEVPSAPAVTAEPATPEAPKAEQAPAQEAPKE